MEFSRKITFYSFFTWKVDLCIFYIFHSRNQKPQITFSRQCTWAELGGYSVYRVNFWNIWKINFSLFTVAPHKKLASAHPVSATYIHTKLIFKYIFVNLTYKYSVAIEMCNIFFELNEIVYCQPTAMLFRKLMTILF